MAAREDYREALTAKLIAELEAGTAPWQKPWADRHALPYNATTDKPYRGVNSLYLSITEMQRGYDDPRWATYRQAQEAGWQVRKGEKGTGIEYWKHTETVEVLDDSGRPATREVRLERPRVFYATVFNAKQMDGVPSLESTRKSYEWDPNERAEAILKASGAKLLHDQSTQAFYVPVRDTIHLPRKDQFPNESAYYGTALHELGHWTGHASRLDRDLSGKFGSESYAKEELRAELSSYFTSDQLGVAHDTNRHAAYVESWIKALKNDKNEIFRAARDAEKITDFILDSQRSRGAEHESAPTSPEASARARAFRELTENEAIQRHPELRPAYDTMHQIERNLAANFKTDRNSLDQYASAARADLARRLEAGEAFQPRAPETIRVQAAEAPSPTSEQDRALRRSIERSNDAMTTAHEAGTLTDQVQCQLAQQDAANLGKISDRNERFSAAVAMGISAEDHQAYRGELQRSSPQAAREAAGAVVEHVRQMVAKEERKSTEFAAMRHAEIREKTGDLER